MPYYELERLVSLVPVVPGLYGFFRTKLWRRVLFWIYCILYPILDQGGGFEATLRLWAGISTAIASLLVLNVLVFCIKRDKALSYTELASLCLVSPLISHFWGKFGGYLAY